MTDGDKTPEQRPGPEGGPREDRHPEVEQRADTKRRPDEGSAPNAQPQDVVDAIAGEPSPDVAGDADRSSAPEIAGGSVVEPTAEQEGQASSDRPLGNLEAMQSRLDSEGSRATGPFARGSWTDPDLEQHPVVRALRANFPEAVLDIIRFRDETTIHVSREEFRNITFFLRDHPHIQLNFLSDLTAVDMLRLRSGPRFDVVAQLYSIPNRVRLRLKTGADDGEPVPSLVPVWNGANWLEREAYDMFGIIFEGHPNLRRVLLPDDWDEGFPLRKDYPLRGWKEFPVYNTERTVPRVRTRWTGRGV